MTGRSLFGMRLRRLLWARRGTHLPVGITIGRLAQQAAVPSAELGLIVRGTAPSPEILKRLGPALGLPVADLFVIAGLPVPPELASAWPTNHGNVGTILRYAIGLSPERRGWLAGAIGSLPVEPRTGPAPPDEYLDQPGALLIRLLKNRNIRPNARLLMEIGDGPYVADSTIGMLGPGRVAVTPRYVTAFAYLLGYPPAEMVALTGVGPVDEEAKPHPASAELAALAWQARRLSSDQLSHLVDLLEDTRRLRPSAVSADGSSESRDGES
ncbi:hypothetical protein ACFQY4_28480 [Catellatospora bangladeshensis]|nr:hypothetical protein [Catellatospora bangladeshensis]